jgi:catechol 2,3-dioxygenase
MKLSHVHLKVRDLDVAVPFYLRLFELEVTEQVGGFAFLGDGKTHHVVALQELGEGAPAPAPFGVGLYHVAFEVETEEELRGLLARAEGLGLDPVLVDHGISWAAYFPDPDGNGLEVFLDRRAVVGSTWEGRTRRLVLT